MAMPAWGQPVKQHRRTAVLRLDFSGEVSEVGKDQLVGRLFEGLAATGFQVFAAEDLATDLYRTAPDLKDCDSSSCWKRIASALQANFLVVGKVDVDQRNYQIALRLVYGGNGQVVASSSEHCEICGIREASETVGLAAGALRVGLDAVEAPANITVQANPRGALITVNGRPVGYAPATIELGAGVHALKLSADGHESLTRNIEITPNTSQELQIDLPVRERPLGGPRWVVAGWVSVALGAAAVVGGAYALSIDRLSGCRADLNDPSSQICDRQHARPLAAVLLATGGGLLGLGGLTLYVNAAGAPRGDSGDAARLSNWQLAVGGRF